jgi:putative membrane protein
MVAWVLTMISIPISRWVVGDEFLVVGVMAGVALQAGAVLAILQADWGTIRTLHMAAVVVPLTWGIEYLGSNTGYPFGEYLYTSLLQPQLSGVPILIPLAWLMMLPPAWAVGLAIAQQAAHTNSGVRKIGFDKAVAASAIAMTAWDLFLDPQMVGWGYWVWAKPGGYFGIPWVNFFGWFVSAAFVSVIIFLLHGNRRQSRSANKLFLSSKAQYALMLVYAITWALQSVGQAVFWDQPGPAAAGFIGMGACLGSAIYNLRRTNPQKTTIS